MKVDRFKQEFYLHEIAAGGSCEQMKAEPKQSLKAITCTGASELTVYVRVYKVPPSHLNIIFCFCCPTYGQNYSCIC